MTISLRKLSVSGDGLPGAGLSDNGMSTSRSWMTNTTSVSYQTLSRPVAIRVISYIPVICIAIPDFLSLSQSSGLI